MFQIKICGITRVDDAVAAWQAGADAIGLNFYDRSPRCISAVQARSIGDALPPGAVQRVGVFVNSSLDEIAAICDQANLDVIQLHGDELPSMIAELSQRLARPIIRAFRCRDDSLDEVDRYLEACEQAGRLPDAVLVDAYSPGEYGGTGKCVDWESLIRERPRLRGLPLILAGGLRPENVAEAIRAVQPSAVDTASGVELSAGIKDHAAVQRFVDAARAGWKRPDASGVERAVGQSNVR
ncbi:MAG: phosphoribosylanthranilate isomerase [Pirellulaceae bacterium]